jgi:hypothetical protein
LQLALDTPGVDFVTLDISMMVEKKSLAPKGGPFLCLPVTAESLQGPLKRG